MKSSKSLIKNNGFFTWAICGPSFSGKSHEVSRILLDEEYGILQEIPLTNIYMFSENALQDSSEKTLIDKLESTAVDLNGEPLFNKSNEVIDNPQEYLRKMQLLMQEEKETPKAERENMLFICDDWSGSSKVSIRDGFLSELCCENRHYNISLIIICHGLKSMDPEQLAEVTHISVYAEKNFEYLKEAFKNIAGEYHKQAVEMYLECIRDPYGYLFIDFTQEGKPVFCRTIDYEFLLDP